MKIEGCDSWERQGKIEDWDKGLGELVKAWKEGFWKGKDRGLEDGQSKRRKVKC